MDDELMNSVKLIIKKKQPAKLLQFVPDVLFFGIIIHCMTAIITTTHLIYIA